MTFTQLLLALQARKRIVLATLLLCMLAAIALSMAMPKTYKATTTLVLNYKGTDPVTGLTLPAQMMPGYMATQVDIIASRNVALKVVDDLQLAQDDLAKEQFVEDTGGEGTIRDWLADRLLKKLDVAPSRESSVINVTFKAKAPEFAAAVANAFATAYQQTTVLLKVEPSQQASSYFSEQVRQLRDRLEAARNKLSSYQKTHGIVNADDKLDVENARLNDLSTQLVMAQAQAMEAASRNRQALGGSAVSPDVLSNPLIQTLKASLATAESKFADTSEKLGPNHPQYQAAKSEVEKLRANLNEQIRLATIGIAGNARILQQREAELRAALDAQKARVMALNSKRDELKVLTNDVDAAQKAYETATQRFTQTSLEGQSNQSDISLLNPAVAPLKAASPKILLNVVVAAFFGTLLGIALAIVAELRDRRVRVVGDLVEVLHAPVLGVVKWTPESPRRLGRFKTALLPNLKAS